MGDHREQTSGAAPRLHYPGSPSKATPSSVRNMRALGEGHPGKSTARSRRNRRRNSPSSRETALQRRETGLGSELGGPTPPPLHHAPAQPGLSSPPAGPGTPRAAGAPSHRPPPDRTDQTRPSPAGASHEYLSPLLALHQPRPGAAAAAAAAASSVTTETPPAGTASRAAERQRPLARAALSAGTAPPGGTARVCVSAPATPAPSPHSRAGRAIPALGLGSVFITPD